MHHITGEILGNQVNIDTLYFAWACMILLLVFFGVLASGLSADPSKYSTRQHFIESTFGFFRNLSVGQIGEKFGEKFTFFIGSIFLFVITVYYAGLLPWKLGSLFAWWPSIESHELGHGAAAVQEATEHAETVAAHGAHEVAQAAHGAHEAVAAGAHEAVAAASHAVHSIPWHGASPAADINIPAAMALVVVVVYLAAGVIVGGWKYVQMFLPINFSRKGISLNLMCLIELMDVVVRPLTLSLRLFANTVAGETLLATFIGLVAILLPAGILGFEIFVGALQAFIFTILSAVYIGTTVKHAEHLVHDH